MHKLRFKEKRIRVHLVMKEWPSSRRACGMRDNIAVIFEKYHLSQMVTNGSHQTDLETNCWESREKIVKMIVVSCFKAWVQAMEVPDTTEIQSVEGPENWTNLYKKHLNSQIPAHSCAVRNHFSPLKKHGRGTSYWTGITERGGTSYSSLGNQRSITAQARPKLVIKWKFAFPKSMASFLLVPQVQISFPRSSWCSLSVVISWICVKDIQMLTSRYF